MRAAIMFGIVIVAASSCSAEARGRRGGGGWGGGSLVSVGGDARRDGTFVAPHLRTSADGDPTTNLSYRGGGATPVRSYPRVASADPSAAVQSLPRPVALVPTMPWCSDGTVVSGFCILDRRPVAARTSSPTTRPSSDASWIRPVSARSH